METVAGIQQTIGLLQKVSCLSATEYLIYICNHCKELNRLKHSVRAT